MREAFAKNGLEPNIVMSIIDDDIMKAYVDAGFGIAIMASMAYNSRKDTSLRAIPLVHLFGTSTCYVMTKEGRYLERHARDFVELVKAHPPAAVPKPEPEASPALYPGKP